MTGFPDASAALRRARALAPGLMLAVTVATAAQFLGEHYGAPTILFALLIGIAFHFVMEAGPCAEGIEFAAKRLLRLAVALLGLRVTVEEIAALGWETALLVACAVIATIGFGIGGARLLGRRIRFGTLTGGSVAICGASAALAIAAILPKNEFSERNLSFTVIAVTAFSTIAMILYPLLTTALGFDDRTAGIFLGATIHDVAQVVGAGYSISPEAGDTATVTKLWRVALLVPVVLALSLYFKRRGGAEPTRLPLPLFVIGFCVCVAVNSAGLVPPAALAGLQEASRWLLITAIAALGVKTSMKALFTIGWQPVVMVLAETLFLALFILTGLLLMI